MTSQQPAGSTSARVPLCETPTGVVDLYLDVMTRTLGSGDLDEVDAWLAVTADRFARDANEGQMRRLAELRQTLATDRIREAAAGGPGSLFDPEHEFAKGRRAAAEAARSGPLP